MLALMSPQALKRDARVKAGFMARLWEHPDSIDARREEVQNACDLSGVKYPQSRWGIFPEMLRTQAPEWWGRRLKKADRQELERAELRAGHIRHYCSDHILNARQQQRRETRELLERMLAVCELDDGERIERELLELVKGSNANPAVRRAELMTRISGFEKFAKRKKHVAYFLTATAPSRFHRNSGADRWSGATPRETQDYMCKVWARGRAQLKREKLELYGFRIAEPHKDACPHWHMLFWFKSHHEARRAITIMRAHFLADTPHEKGAQQRRFTTKRIDARRGSATGYIAKYICKNVDGIYDDKGTERRFDDQRRDRRTGEMQGTGLSSEEAALRVEAWAACWGIRQFQQIGGPKVGAWRELRRMREEYTGHGADLVEPLRAAADSGQWDMFVELDEEHRDRFGGRVSVWGETSTEKLMIELRKIVPVGPLWAGDWEKLPAETIKGHLNPWQEPTKREVKGVAVGWLKLKTRWLKWVLMLKEAMEAKSERQQFREHMAAFMERVLEARREAVALLEPTAAPPPWALDLCQ